MQVRPALTAWSKNKNCTKSAPKAVVTGPLRLVVTATPVKGMPTSRLLRPSVTGRSAGAGLKPNCEKLPPGRDAERESTEVHCLRVVVDRALTAGADNKRRDAVRAQKSRKAGGRERDRDRVSLKANGVNRTPRAGQREGGPNRQQ